MWPRRTSPACSARPQSSPFPTRRPPEAPGYCTRRGSTVGRRYCRESGDLIDIIEEEGFRGVYFEPGDPISLADALAKVLDDDSLRDDLGRRNFAAASGIPMSEVVHWHVVHVRRILDRRMLGRAVKRLSLIHI